MISCLMVTQPGREACCRASIASFAAQTLADRELVIVHDGPLTLSPWLEPLVAEYRARYPGLEILLSASPEGCLLGALRNRSIGLASRPVVCTWDDDDLSHPQRLEIQHSHLNETDSDFCFLTDQLHLYTREKVLFWDDWANESWPANLIQNTLMGRKAVIGTYPDVQEDEDMDLVYRLYGEGRRIVALPDMGWLYIYVFHGGNLRDEIHHKDLSWRRRRGKDALCRDLPLLQKELPGYGLPYRSLDFLHASGRLTVVTNPNL